MWNSSSATDVSMTDDVTTLSMANDVATPSVTSSLSPDFVARLKYTVMTSYMSAFVLGVVGNALVLYVVARYKSVRVNSVANYYVWSLALADLLHVTSLPIYVWATYEENWPIESPALADVSCKLAFVTSDVSRFASAFILTALSLDRYFAGFLDLGHVRTVSMGQRACALIWLVCIVLATPYLLYARVIHMGVGPAVGGGAYNATVGQSNGPLRRSCRMDWPRMSPDGGGVAYRATWVYVQATLGLLAPSIVILTSYALLYCRLRVVYKRRLRLATVSYNAKSDVTNSSSRRACKSKAASRRMTLTVFTVVVAFIVCQAPNHVNQLISLWGWTVRSCVDGARGGICLAISQSGNAYVLYWSAFAQILTFVSSCTNPFIYGMMNENYRRLYRRALCCRPAAQRRPRSPPGGAALAMLRDA